MENLYLNDGAVFYLADTRKWARFLAIIGYVTLGLIVVLAIFMAFAFDPLMEATVPDYPISGKLIGAIYLVEAVLFYFPVSYLNKFSIIARNALNSGEESQIADAFRYLRAHYRFVGIMTIVFLALAGLGLVVGFFAGMVGAFMV